MVHYPVWLAALRRQFGVLFEHPTEDAPFVLEHRNPLSIHKESQGGARFISVSAVLRGNSEETAVALYHSTSCGNKYSNIWPTILTRCSLYLSPWLLFVKEELLTKLADSCHHLFVSTKDTYIR